MKTYVTFDRLRLSLPTETVSILQPELFTSTVTGEGEVLRQKYEQTTPFYYSIMIDASKQTTIVEFNGKVLLDAYPDLICWSNISTCFENINRLQVCYINSTEAIEQAYVLQCDVTRDIVSPHSIKELQQNLTIRNTRKWCIRDITSTRFTLESTNVTKRIKTRMVIYDKGVEMKRKPNDCFLASINNADEQLDYFKRRIRYELNLNSIDRIRTFFNLTETKLCTLLMSSEDPIGKFLDDIVVNDCGLRCAASFSGNLRTLEHLLLLAICDYDLVRVEMLIRDMYGSNRSITRSIEPYQHLYTRLIATVQLPQHNPALADIRNSLRFMLATTFNGDGQTDSVNISRLYNSSIMSENVCAQVYLHTPNDYLNLQSVELNTLPELD